MLQLITRVAQKARVKMAIGGGIAIQTYGYKRETSDVDAFFHYKDRLKVLRALQQMAKDYVIEELDQSHWVAIPIGSPPDERIDLLFASGDPEESSIELAEKRSYNGVVAPVFPIDLLIISKFLAEREDAKDWLDIYTLYKRGAFDPKQIVKRLTQMDQKEDAKRFLEFLDYLNMIAKKKRQ